MAGLQYPNLTPEQRRAQLSVLLRPLLDRVEARLLAQAQAQQTAAAPNEPQEGAD